MWSLQDDRQVMYSSSTAVCTSCTEDQASSLTFHRGRLRTRARYECTSTCRCGRVYDTILGMWELGWREGSIGSGEREVIGDAGGACIKCQCVASSEGMRLGRRYQTTYQTREREMEREMERMVETALCRTICSMQ
jgi:hypothetical protein